ncbi:MAG: hypothetical protein A3C50_00110 [Candidatus Staskawiczbacteria bacterium RIFCSPHIGHO2_02_FULL_43_16]|uniref:Uncharacterized protein n=1 Tax=Candidatus Staskawiczbacteria bacterium RIFCSPHIGHO2_01_FULL_41_41 TaxID=1802203 RepID=A0A1G2HV70_9BACT|nr:MAG: hypothetical protein A2822_01775 [Candidatus Staskawiczbacteria bacterium RIFCSPHIGHO2_01_FULL_41_41]OGZ68899.1 MAG: hypothetical protein A3C50_00110 [Candidatus Staskawiczbacteria bacterium RIFCSPHIGHO2_02_FULL_43_16]OGZ74919.1 MAG: hypothetical protein A3A12_03705 [Candidatus Staskawiczbacteria bacterium RIFCSPLOWO2_01_FULL_43_17b]
MLKPCVELGCSGQVDITNIKGVLANLANANPGYWTVIDVCECPLCRRLYWPGGKPVEGNGGKKVFRVHDRNTVKAK